MQGVAYASERLHQLSKDNQFNDPTIVGQKTSKPALVNAEGPPLIDQKPTLTRAPEPPILLLR
jgi:hypothetical protein